jgi:soluble P-type ATPase
MNLTNLIRSLQDVSNTLSIVNENCDVKGKRKIIEDMKKKSVSDLNNIINDLQALQRERVGLEMGAWRV